MHGNDALNPEVQEKEAEATLSSKELAVKYDTAK